MPPGKNGLFRVFGLGTVVVDHQVMLSELPAADTKGEVIDDRYQVGGPVPTALSLLRQLGCDAAFQGKWSGDPFGQTIEADFRAQSIAFDPGCCRTASRTGFAHVWVEQRTGRRSIAAYRGSHPVEPHDLTFDQLAGFDAIHLDGWSSPAAIALATEVKAKGGLVSLDLGSPKPQLDQLLACVDIVNCPERLIHRVFGTDNLVDGAGRLLCRGPRAVTVTCGEHGALHVSAKGVVTHPGFRVDALDTNGAGDVFAGAVLYSVLHGWPPERQLDFACAAAALKCTQLGNRDALPTLEQIENFLAEESVFA